MITGKGEDDLLSHARCLIFLGENQHIKKFSCFEGSKMNSKFSYGDAVIIKQNAPSSLHPGEVGSVCSLNQITSEQEAEGFKCQVGEWVYTVEFENGSDIQVAECYLDKDLGIIQGGELSKYGNCFVGGFVFDIKMNLSCIEIKIRSEKINQAISGNVLISNDGFFSGKLIIPQIQEMAIRNSSFSVAWQEKGTILAFEVSYYLLNLLIEWRLNKTTSFHIKAGQIWWEQR
jgi:hypothetical protein